VIEAGEDMHFLEKASALWAEVIGGENLDGDSAKSCFCFLSFVDASKGTFSEEWAEFDSPDELVFMLLCAQKIESTERADRAKSLGRS